MFKIEMIDDVKNLPPDIREYEEDYYDADCTSYLLMYRNGKLDCYATDHMEPEDVRFWRDLSWIESWIKKAYQYGVEDGKREVTDNTPAAEALENLLNRVNDDSA